VSSGYTVPVYYDSMIAKLVAWAESREQAIARMSRALSEYQVLGIRTTIPFFVWLMDQADYRDGNYDTSWLDRVMADRNGIGFNELDDEEETLAAIAASIDSYLRAHAHASDHQPASPVSVWQRTARTEALRG
jgi:acetyl/propionyl-CoA carboxylase alpha subunit